MEFTAPLFLLFDFSQPTMKAKSLRHSADTGTSIMTNVIEVTDLVVEAESKTLRSQRRKNRRAIYRRKALLRTRRLRDGRGIPDTSK